MSERVLVACGLSTDAVQDLRARGHVVEVAGDGYRTIELAERVHPDAVVFAVGTAGPPIGELIERIRVVRASCRVLAIVPEPDPERDAEMVVAGANGLLVASPAIPFLEWAIAKAISGGLVLDPSVARGLGEVMAESATQRSEWARQLAERARQAEDLARAKQDFLSNVSHELRTPLTIIKGVAGMLRMKEKDENQSRMLSQIESASDNLVAMIESIITQSSMERGDYSVSVVACDLAGTIRTAANEAAANYPNITLEMSIPERVPALADVRAIRGVVMHLVDNACRYSDAGGVVTLNTRSGDEGMSVHVSDRGVGVNRERVAEALAEAFSPGEAIMTKERAGLGLGLNLARNLIALHGGILWAEPLPAGGSRVSFTIPPAAARGTVETGSASLTTAGS